MYPINHFNILYILLSNNHECNKMSTLRYIYIYMYVCMYIYIYSQWVLPCKAQYVPLYVFSFPYLYVISGQASYGSAEI